MNVELPAIFHDRDRVQYADTCEPLKDAAERGEVCLKAWSHSSYPGLKLPVDYLPEMRSLGFWDASRYQKWGLANHSNEGLEFTYLAKGKTAFDVDGKKYKLSKGSFTITRPWQIHSVGDPNVSASCLCWLILDVKVRRPNQEWKWPEWLILSPEDFECLTQLLRHNEQPVWEADKEIIRVFNKLSELVEHNGPTESKTKVKLYINELLIAVMEMLQREKIPLDKNLSTTHRAVEMFLSSLQQHANHQWDLNSMAEQCGISRSQFSNYCKQITNMTPIEYLVYCRLDIASKLLVENPEMTVTDIAYECGFNSSQYFAVIFHSRRGATPSEFRNKSKR
jgi:AraC-like DNA-binding protein